MAGRREDLSAVGHEVRWGFMRSVRLKSHRSHHCKLNDFSNKKPLTSNNCSGFLLKNDLRAGDEWCALRAMLRSQRQLLGMWD
jgi:hypothetical protein